MEISSSMRFHPPYIIQEYIGLSTTPIALLDLLGKRQWQISLNSLLITIGFSFLSISESIYRYYGIAMISNSWTAFALALFAQGCNQLFNRYVEE